jgi:hypothetical protein
VLTLLPGHMAGQMEPKLESRRHRLAVRAMCSGLDRLGARALFCGDAMHSPIQLRQPAVSISSCSGPEFATRTRIALLQEAAVTGRVFVPGMRAVLRCDTPCAARGMVPSLLLVAAHCRGAAESGVS